MLEQLGGNQFRRFSLSAEKRKVIAGRPPANGEDQDAGWDFIIQHGERDKGNLKQLRWIHHNINGDGSPIHGWNEKLVQRALDSLANDGTMAAVISRYNLTIDAIEPDVLEIIEKVVPHLRGHALWLLGEPGVGKTLLGRMLAMMFCAFMEGLAPSDQPVTSISLGASSSTRPALLSMMMERSGGVDQEEESLQRRWRPGDYPQGKVDCRQICATSNENRA